MARLIEVDDVASLPDRLTLRMGDLLMVRATGARIISGRSLRALGPFELGVVGTNGQIISPAGPPGSALLEAVAPGGSTVAIMAGDPFGISSATEVEIVVE